MLHMQMVATFITTSSIFHISALSKPVCIFISYILYLHKHCWSMPQWHNESQECSSNLIAMAATIHACTQIMKEVNKQLGHLISPADYGRSEHHSICTPCFLAVVTSRCIHCMNFGFKMGILSFWVSYSRITQKDKIVLQHCDKVKAAPKMNVSWLAVHTISVVLVWLFD